MGHTGQAKGGFQAQIQALDPLGAAVQRRGHAGNNHLISLTLGDGAVRATGGFLGWHAAQGNKGVVIGITLDQGHAIALNAPRLTKAFLRRTQFALRGIKWVNRVVVILNCLRAAKRT